MILTQPDNDEDCTPQVLARSVIHKRYPREDAPMVGTQPTSTALTFYRSDRVTPLGDLGSFDEAPGARDILDDGIFEVYGPPTKRQRSSIDNASTPSFDIIADVHQ